jgi:hypothetical protein
VISFGDSTVFNLETPCPTEAALSLNHVHTLHPSRPPNILPSQFEGGAPMLIDDQPQLGMVPSPSMRYSPCDCPMFMVTLRLRLRSG